VKILHLSCYDFGGAANAAIRLHEGLLATGVESRLACKTSSKPKPGIFPVLTSKGDWLAKNSTRIDYHWARWTHPRVKPVLAGPTLSGGGLRALEHPPEVRFRVAEGQSRRAISGILSHAFRE
jgi:hypothetical protein